MTERENRDKDKERERNKDGELRERDSDRQRQRDKEGGREGGERGRGEREQQVVLFVAFESFKLSVTEESVVIFRCGLFHEK